MALDDATALRVDPGQTRRRHSSGLDGLRGIAVVLVVIFHFWPSVLPGGFLGVSLFFTLSGYLITNLLLAEHASTGTIGLAPFWGRRFRRLMPAALTTLAVVLILGQWLTSPADLSAQVAAATVYIYNWFQISQGTDYGAMFADPSPIEHFWSLAIEEQFYVVFPLIAAGALRFGRRAFLVTSSVLLAGSLITVALTASSPEVSYLSTFTRAAELLAGVVLAFVWPLSEAAGRGSRQRSVMGLAAIAMLIVASRVVHYSDWFVSHGLLPMIAVVSCIAITFASTTRADQVLGRSVIVWLGKRSYAIYLIHWPVDVWLPANGIVKVAVTFVLAELSWHLVESPVRLRQVLARPHQAAAAAFASVTMLLALCVVAPHLDLDRSDTSEMSTASTVPRAATSGGSAGDPADDPAGVPSDPAATGQPVTIWWIGDSQSDGLMDTLTGRRDPASLTIEGATPDTTAFATEINGRPATVVDLAAIACDGGGGTNKLRYTDGKIGTEIPGCSDWEARWQDAIDGWGQPDLVIWAVGGSTTWLPRSFVGSADDDWKLPSDPEWQRWWTDTSNDRLSWLEGNLPTTTPIAWLTPAVPNRGEYKEAVAPSDEEWQAIVTDTAVVARLQREIAASHPRVSVIDFGAWKATAGDGGTDLTGTLDGVHWDERTANGTVLPWYFDQIRQLLDVS